MTLPPNPFLDRPPLIYNYYCGECNDTFVMKMPEISAHWNTHGGPSSKTKHVISLTSSPPREEL
jgi:hypothetical protein